MSDPVLVARSQVALAIKRRDPVAEESGRRALAAAKLQRAIGEALSADPPMTDEQREHCASLLSGAER